MTTGWIITMLSAMRRGITASLSGPTFGACFRPAPRSLDRCTVPNMTSIERRPSSEIRPLGPWHRAVILATLRDELIDPFAADETFTLLFARPRPTASAASRK
jgi:hypothetical protein